jgi:hypothetical protein
LRQFLQAFSGHILPHYIFNREVSIKRELCIYDPYGKNDIQKQCQLPEDEVDQ